MSALFRTFSARINHQALGDMAALHGHVERRLYAAVKSGRQFTGDLAVSFYQQFGISAKTLNGIQRQLSAKLKSISELAKLQADEVELKIKVKVGQIAEAKKSIVIAREKGGSTKALRQKLHQYNRRLGNLETKLAMTKRRISDPYICFGSRKLFNAQHHLSDNQYADHAEWLKDWRAARSSQFFIEGDASTASGNAFVRLTQCGGGSFDLELRLPEALEHRAERRYQAGGRSIRCIDLRGLRFRHGEEDIRQALIQGKPLSYRFMRADDGAGWTVAVMIRQEFADGVADFSAGALGVDLNVDHVAVTLADADGNPRMTRRIDLVTYGKTKKQREDMVRKAAAAIVKLAVELRVPVVAEKLDFRRKMVELTSADGKRRARMLSSFAFTAFGTALSRACVRRSVRLVLVNPAYTSLIGRVKFAPRYGLSVHAAAALSIARRGMDLSERLPAGEHIEVRLADGDHVALDRPARNGRRHVWSSWGRLHADCQRFLQNGSRARRKARSGGARGRKASGDVRAGKGLVDAPSWPGRCDSPTQRGRWLDFAVPDHRKSVQGCTKPTRRSRACVRRTA